MSSYPNSLDTNLTVPQVEDGVTETTSEAFNDLRDAVLNLERYLGIGINGNLSSLADRIKGVIDADGGIDDSDVVLLNVTGGGSQKLKEDKDCYQIKPDIRLATPDADLGELQQALTEGGRR